MLGRMMDIPLLISSLIMHADRHHGDTEIVTRTVEGPIHRYTYRDAHLRSRQLAGALEGLSHAELLDGGFRRQSVDQLVGDVGEGC